MKTVRTNLFPSRAAAAIVALVPGLCTAEPLAYITNYLDNTVSVIDTATDEVVDTFPGLPGGSLGPWGVTVNPRGNAVYLSQPFFRSSTGGGDELAVVTTRNPHRIKGVSVGHGAFGIAIDPIGNAVYQVNSEDGAISVVSPNGNRSSSLPLQLRRPLGIATAIVAGERRLYVTEMEGNSVAIVDPVTRTLSGRIPVGRQPTGIAVNTLGTRAYVANYQDHTLSVINTGTSKVIRTIPVGDNPYGVAVNPKGTRVYVANQPAGVGGKPAVGSVSVINAVSLAETARVRVGKTPTGLAVTGDGTKVYVANSDSHTVSVINARAKAPKVTKSLAVGRGPIAFGSFINSPTHYVVAKMRGKVIASLHLIRRRDKKEVLTAYPRGRAFATSANSTRQLSIPEFQQFMAAQRSVSPAAASSSVSNTGLALGYAPSVGPTSGDCYNFSTQQPNSPSTQLAFSSANTASSYAAQVDVSSSINTQFLGFKASDSFSLSDNWKNSANSGQVYFNASAIYALQNVLDETNPLNAYGNQALTGGVFSQLCGTEFVSQVPAGMLVTGQLSWSSSSAQAASAISNQFQENYTLLEGLSAAVSASQNVQNASTEMDFTLQILGGGDTAAQTMLNAYQGAASTLTSCTMGNPPNCTAFATTMNSAASQALGQFINQVTTPLPQNLSFFEAFPFGVAGVPTQPLMTLPLTSIITGISDVFAPYQNQLNTYMSLLNQIVTLNNRVNYLYNAVSSDSFNPVNMLNLLDYLQPLQNTYSADSQKLLTNLTTCLDGQSSNVSTACAPIINNSFTNAYDWYAAGGGNPNWAAQENTVALQYASTYTDNQKSEYPNDVLYIDQLPPYSGSGSAIANDAALVTFADAPYYFGATQTVSSVSITALDSPTADLSTIYTSAIMQWNGIFNDGWSGPYAPISWTTPQCNPTFQSPCGIGFSAPSVAPTYNSLTAIPNFFTTPD